MSISDIFYTEKCFLLREELSEPNSYGICTKIHEFISEEPVPCAVAEISNNHAQQKYGINIQATTEISFDIDKDFDCRQVKAIMFNDVVYEVKDYRVYEPFMILSRSVTYAVVERGVNDG